MARNDNNKSQVKTLEELSRTYTNYKESWQQLNDRIDKGDLDAIKDYLDSLKKVKDIDVDRLALAKDIKKALQSQIKELQELKAPEKTIKNIESAVKQIDKIIKNTTNSQDLYNKVLQKGRDILRETLKTQQEIYKTSHDMQLQSNLTWKEFTRAYNEAYKAAVKMNTETGKQLFTAKEIIQTQNQLLKDGWRNIDATTLTDVSSSVRLLATTLGIDFPQELSTAFQMSFRQFNTSTNEFITQIGNRLNAFSDTFGVSIGMLTSVVSQMSASNSFIYKANMEAQLRANENLIKAAALSGAIGLTSSNFISDLALTSEYGTAEDVSSIYQGGALLQGFNTQDFLESLNTGNTDTAISDLFGSIYETINGLNDNKFLRNEYMKQIGSAFGLSQADLLQIATNGNNLDAYSKDLTDKLENVNTSMKDEISGLKIDILDQLNNWWQNTTIVKAFGSVMNNLGLYGVADGLTYTNSLLSLILASINKDTISNIFKGFKGGGTTGGTTSNNPLSFLGLNLGRPQVPSIIDNTSLTTSIISQRSIGTQVAGLGLGLVGNSLGSSLQQDTSMSNAGANTLGGITNIASGALGGFMLGGGPVGALVGGTLGLINTISNARKRESTMEQLEDQRRIQQRNERTTSTSDPIVNAINQLNNDVVGAITGQTENLKETAIIEQTYNITTTKGTLLNNLGDNND